MSKHPDDEPRELPSKESPKQRKPHCTRCKVLGQEVGASQGALTSGEDRHRVPGGKYQGGENDEACVHYMQRLMFATSHSGARQPGPFQKTCFLWMTVLGSEPPLEGVGRSGVPLAITFPSPLLSGHHDLCPASGLWVPVDPSHLRDQTSSVVPPLPSWRHGCSSDRWNPTCLQRASPHSHLIHFPVLSNVRVRDLCWPDPNPQSAGCVRCVRFH